MSEHRHKTGSDLSRPEEAAQNCACGAGCEVESSLGMPRCTYEELGEVLEFIEDVVEG